jgi:Fe2+ or Zn2+ uptake regulation protein
MKQKVLEFLNSQSGEVTLKDIYKQFPAAKQESIRSALNLLVKKGEIKRTGLAKYLKSEHSPQPVPIQNSN